MAIEKTGIPISFTQGLDLKTDPKQIGLGKFLSLKNSVFNKSGLLQKRNGFGDLTALSASHLNTLTTFNGNLTAIGQSLYAFSQESDQWLNKGSIYSAQLETVPLVRTSSQQNTVDVAVNSEGLVCTVWEDSNTSSLYQIVDSLTGQVLISNGTIASGAKIPRVFNIGNYFVITFLISITGTPHLQYIAVSTSDVTSVTAAVDLSVLVSSVSAGYDGQVISDNLYVAWNGSDGGGAVRVTYIDSNLNQHATTAMAGRNCVTVSVCGDLTTINPTIWVSFNDSSNNGWTASFTNALVAGLAPTQIWTTITVINLTSLATNNINTIYYETSNVYSGGAVRSDYISKVTCTSVGVVGSPSVVVRSLALASKAFVLNSTRYMLGVYGGTLQPTYFLVDDSGNVVAKIAYSNGGGYPSDQILSNAIVNDSTVSIGYRFKDLLTSVNKEQSGAAGGIYSQTGINLANITISDAPMVTSEIASSLHLTGGFLWQYDGVKPVEHSFHLWPEDVTVTTADTGGHLSAQIYFHQVVYEWTDSQGNLHRSAPSVPIESDLTGSGTSTNIITLQIPTLRLTYKTAPNSVRLVVYRWSTANQQYYQSTSIASPTLNNPAVDTISYVDTLADSSIIGNALIYTTGGVVENIAAPACSGICMFKTRLMVIYAEDPNVIGYSKQVIENVPVEMSDLFTQYVAPTIGAQGSTGHTKVISAMDDKFLMFKRDAIYYMTGQGPDNAGANNDFSDPVFITSTVGCSNAQSLAFIPQGLMFQSDKGIWLLGRDLSTQYIGAPVESLTDGATVLSALTIPETNQVRFTLDTGVTLLYDYYYAQWGSFYGIPAISGCLYQNLHTILNSYGLIKQETPGFYLDGSNPVLMSFKTGWLNLNGVQGYERAYYFYLLGQYITPHKLNILIAYDYNSSPSQSDTIQPDNYSPVYGDDPIYGSSSPYGGAPNKEQWRVFLRQQQCQAFQITFNEIYDATFGVTAGAGLTLSGIDLVIGAKKKWPRIAPKYSVG